MALRATSYGQDLHAGRRAVKDNSDRHLSEKIRLRQEVLKALPAAAVLDCFAGTGVMWRYVWRDAAGYRGIELDLAKAAHHPGLVFCGSAERLLPALPLETFGIFDLDAYGSPWAIARLLVRRRLGAGERIALVMTDGSVRRAALGLVEGALADLAGVVQNLPAAHRQWMRLARAACTTIAVGMGGRVERMGESRVPHHSHGIWHGYAIIGSAT